MRYKVLCGFRKECHPLCLSESELPELDLMKEWAFIRLKKKKGRGAFQAEEKRKSKGTDACKLITSFRHSEKSGVLEIQGTLD